MEFDSAFRRGWSEEAQEKVARAILSFRELNYVWLSNLMQFSTYRPQEYPLVGFSLATESKSES